jgi:glutamate carboxypeptidase
MNASGRDYADVTGAQLSERLRRWTFERSEQIVSDLAALVALDAPSGDVVLLNANAAILERRAQEIGGRVRRWETEAGTHLEVRFGPDAGSPVLLLAHYDTVWPRGTAAVRPFSREDGIIRGPGVFDMRGGLVAALNAVAALSALDSLVRPVVVLLTADEETGSTTSEELIVTLGRQAAAVLVPEPPLPDGGLKTQRKGVLTYGLSVSGLASHAGLDPERGISAVHELLDLAQAARAVADPSRGTTVNIGLLGGGSRSNVVAADASAEIDVRVASQAEYERAETWFRRVGASVPGAAVTVELRNARPPMERTPAIATAAARAKELASLLDLELTEGPAGGASDANFLAQYEVSIIDGLGPRGGGAHALDEHIVVDSLLERVALLALLVARL